MAPPLFGNTQITTALRNEAMPALERLAEDQALRDHAVRRFNRDEPPPYLSSTEEDEDDIIHPSLGPLDDKLLVELNALVDKPLDDEECDDAASFIQNIPYQPGRRYDEEVDIERLRVDSWVRQNANPDVYSYFIQHGFGKEIRAGVERTNIIARRNIKRRWQKLGVWNSEWGIPDRADDPQPNDDKRKWKWRWQHGAAAAEWKSGLNATERNPQHPTTRALRLRRGLRRGEQSPAIPHPRLPEDAPASQAESFIISRPWFTYMVERGENATRIGRLSRRYPVSVSRRYRRANCFKVEDTWKENGEWKETWQDQNGRCLAGWKWRHESPSPEPEDLSGLNDLASFELTPSEADALEAVRPPTPPPPKVYGRRIPQVPTRYGGLFGNLIPGDGGTPEEEETGEPMEEVEAPGADEQPTPLRLGSFDGSDGSVSLSRYRGLFDGPRPEEAAAAADKRTDEPMGEAEAVDDCPPPPRQRRLPVQQPTEQPPRRSPRIAALKAKQERENSQQERQQSRRTRARPMPAAAPPATGRPKRGRPRKTSAGASKLSPRPRRGRPRKTSAGVSKPSPRPRGRPRKTRGN